MSPNDSKRLPGDRLWTIGEVAYFLGVPVATLYYWRTRGEGRSAAASGGTCATGPTGSGRGWMSELQGD